MFEIEFFREQRVIHRGRDFEGIVLHKLITLYGGEKISFRFICGKYLPPHIYV